MLLSIPFIKALCDRTEQEKQDAQKNDKRSHQFLLSLLRKKENLECADCTSRFPGWAALPHGVFICINCAQIHRGIGRHISQVKGVNTGTYLWYPDEINAMAIMGNEKANNLYLSGGGAQLPPKPSKDAPYYEKEKYIRDKYEKKKWFTTTNPATTTNASRNTNSNRRSSPPSPSHPPPALRNVIQVSTVTSSPLKTTINDSAIWDGWGTFSKESCTTPTPTMTTTSTVFWSNLDPITGTTKLPSTSPTATNTTTTTTSADFWSNWDPMIASTSPPSTVPTTKSSTPPTTKPLSTSPSSTDTNTNNTNNNTTNTDFWSNWNPITISTTKPPSTTVLTTKTPSTTTTITSTNATTPIVILDPNSTKNATLSTYDPWANWTTQTTITNNNNTTSQKQVILTSPTHNKDDDIWGDFC